MASILSDEQLEGLVCTQCSKYLSRFPVKNYENREVKCGRCNREGDGGTKSLFELVVKNCLFKCVNRYEGCSKLLLPEVVAVHEEGCTGGSVVCPKCEDGNERSVLDLIRHYKIQHPTRYLRKNCYKGSLIDKDTLLYIQDDVVFFISLQYSLGTLYANAATLTREQVVQEFVIITGCTVKLTPMRLCKSWSESKDCCDIIVGPLMDPVKIIFNLDILKACRKVYEVALPLKVSSSEKKTSNRSDTWVVPRVYTSADVQVQTEMYYPVFKQDKSVLTHQNVLKVELISDNNLYPFFKLNAHRTALVGINGEKINLICSNCKHFIGQFVYKCVSGVHFMCQDCRNWCHICNCLVEKMNYDLQDHVKFPCRWNCGQFSEFDHEFICEGNRKKCPVCSTKMQVRLMPNHFLKDHGLNFSYKFNLANYLERNHHKKRGEQYFLLCHKLFHLQWQQKPDNPILYELIFRHFESLENGQLAIIRTMSNGKMKYKHTNHIHIFINQLPKLHLEISSK